MKKLTLTLLFLILSINCFALDFEIITTIESQNMPFLIGKNGERGLMQLKRIAWEDVIRIYPKMEKYSYDKYAFDSKINIRFGKLYFKVLEKYFKHYNIEINDRNLIIAYNWGIKNFRTYLKTKILRKITKDYLKKYYNLLKN